MRQVIDRRTTIQKLRACMSKLEQACTEHACTLFLRIVFFPEKIWRLRVAPKLYTHAQELVRQRSERAPLDAPLGEYE